MGDSDIGLVLDAVSELRKDVREMRAEMKKMFQEGCALAPGHLEVRHDVATLCTRMSAVEDWKTSVVAKITVIMSIGGIIAAALWSWVKGKLGIS